MNNSQYMQGIQQGQIQHLQTTNMILMAQNSHQSGGRTNEPIWILEIGMALVFVFLVGVAIKVWWEDRKELKKNG